MGVGRTVERVKIYEWRWVLFMFVTLDGEVLAKKDFRRVWYSIILMVGKGKKGIKKI